MQGICTIAAKICASIFLNDWFFALLEIDVREMIGIHLFALFDGSLFVAHMKGKYTVIDVRAFLLEFL